MKIWRFWNKILEIFLTEKVQKIRRITTLRLWCWLSANSSGEDFDRDTETLMNRKVSRVQKIRHQKGVIFIQNFLNFFPTKWKIIDISNSQQKDAINRKRFVYYEKKQNYALNFVYVSHALLSLFQNKNLKLVKKKGDLHQNVNLAFSSNAK